MNNKTGLYHVIDLPAARRDVLDFIDLASWEHRMFGLLEIDVTIARQFIEAHKAATGERLSFTGYLAFCVAKAVDEDKSVQAYRKGRNQLVLFDDVDVGLMIERPMGELRVPVGYVIRRANHKTFTEIHQEIREVQAAPAPLDQEPPLALRLLRPLPRLANSLVHAAIRRDPAGTWVAMAGTVGMSSVGMFGKGSGWPVAAPAGHPLCLYVGGIGCRPTYVDDRIEPREFLSLTVAFDHDVVDGAPAARFTQRLKSLIESGHGLEAVIPSRPSPPSP